MRRWLAVGATTVALALGACSGGDDGAVEAPFDPPADPTGGSTTTTAVVILDDPAATVTSAAPAAQTPLPSGREAIDAVLAAWSAGDRPAALRVASAEAVDALFAVPVDATEDRGCNRGNVNTAIQCVFRLPSGELQVRARPTLDGGGFLVDFVLLGS